MHTIFKYLIRFCNIFLQPGMRQVSPIVQIIGNHSFTLWSPRVGKVIHLKICKWLKFNHAYRWHKQSAQENARHKLVCI